MDIAMLSAQTVSDSLKIKQKHKNYFSFSGGINYADRVYKDKYKYVRTEYYDYLDQHEEPGIGYGLTMLYTIKLYKSIYTVAGIQFNKFVFQGNRKTQYHYRFEHSIIGIPLALNFHFLKNKSLIVGCSFQPSLLVKVTKEFTDTMYYKSPVINFTKPQKVFIKEFKIEKIFLPEKRISFALGAWYVWYKPDCYRS